MEQNAAEWVRTNFKDYIEADGNGVTEAFITMDTDKDAVKVKKNLQIRCRRRSRQIRFRWERQEAFSRVKVTESTIGNLSMGGYLLLMTGGSKIYSPVFTHIYPKFSDDTKEWAIVDGDITITAKGTNPTIKKTVKNADGKEISTTAIGDTVTLRTDS